MSVNGFHRTNASKSECQAAQAEWRSRKGGEVREVNGLPWPVFAGRL
jgi:hypothetical protein